MLQTCYVLASTYSEFLFMGPYAYVRSKTSCLTSLHFCSSEKLQSTPALSLSSLGLHLSLCYSIVGDAFSLKIVLKLIDFCMFFILNYDKIQIQGKVMIFNYFFPIKNYTCRLSKIHSLGLLIQLLRKERKKHQQKQGKHHDR